MPLDRLVEVQGVPVEDVSEKRPAVRRGEVSGDTV